MFSSSAPSPKKPKVKKGAYKKPIVVVRLPKKKPFPIPPRVTRFNRYKPNMASILFFPPPSPRKTVVVVKPKPRKIRPPRLKREKPFEPVTGAPNKCFVYLNETLYDMNSGVLTVTSNRTSNSSYTYSSLGDLKVRVNNPDWKRKIAIKSDASSPYYVREYKLTPALRHISSADQVTGFRKITSYVDQVLVGALPNITADLEDSALRDIALRRLNSKLTLGNQTAKAMVPIAEYKDFSHTLTGIRTSLNNLVEALVFLKRKDFKNAHKRAADLWLTWSFGISPALGDLKDIAAVIEAHLLKRDITNTCSASSKKTWETCDVVTSFPGGRNASLTSTASSSHKLQYRYVASYVYNRLSSSNDYSIWQDLGLTPENFIPTVWEWIPYSWVIDFVTTTGEFLDDTFTSNPGRCIYLNLTRKYTVETVTSFVAVPSFSSTVILSDSGDKAVSRYFEMRRSVLASLPNRIVRFKSYKEISANATNRLLNLVSVLKPTGWNRNPVRHYNRKTATMHYGERNRSEG